jgi:hypothetical protein
MKNNSALLNWLKDNLWNLIVTIAIVISTFTLLKYRVDALEQKIAEYPSKDWFELRFTGIDEKFGTVGRDMQELKNDFKLHVAK